MKTQNKVSIIPLSIVFSFLMLATANGQWVPTNVGPSANYISSLVVKGDNIFAGTSSGILHSTDNGKSWKVADSGLVIPYSSYYDHNINCLALNGSNLFAGKFRGGIYHSTDNGTSWTGLTSGLTPGSVVSLLVSDTYLFAGTDDGLFLSTNNGASWVDFVLTGKVVGALAMSGTNLFAGTSEGVFVSTNNGKNWKAIDSGLENHHVHSSRRLWKQIFLLGRTGAFFVPQITE